PHATSLCNIKASLFPVWSSLLLGYLILSNNPKAPLKPYKTFPPFARLSIHMGQNTPNTLPSLPFPAKSLISSA
ncbi:MAG: hypothetical protein J0H87_06975, partial [Holosporales bacterium]|nr:hypothetical protein [Holosporales bacterium]